MAYAPGKQKKKMETILVVTIFDIPMPKGNYIMLKLKALLQEIWNSYSQKTNSTLLSNIKNSMNYGLYL